MPKNDIHYRTDASRFDKLQKEAQKREVPLNQLIDSAIDQFFCSPRDPTGPQESNAFQKPELECKYAAWVAELNKVRCTCSYPTLKKWQPKNRLIYVSECERCNIEDVKGTRFGIDQWLTKKGAEEEDNTTFHDGIKFPFYCVLKNKSYYNENEWTRKFCHDCQNVKCGFKLRHPRF